MKQKYKNIKITTNGIKFDSKLEAQRYKELILLQENGVIEQLELQPKFRLANGFKMNTNKGLKTIYPMQYFADFKYLKNGLVIVEDTKGVETKDYIIKKKLFLSDLDKFGVDCFKEVKRKGSIDYFKINS